MFFVKSGLNFVYANYFLKCIRKQMTKSVLELNKCPKVLIICVYVMHIITGLKKETIKDVT